MRMLRLRKFTRFSFILKVKSSTVELFLHGVQHFAVCISCAPSNPRCKTFGAFDSSAVIERNPFTFMEQEFYLDRLTAITPSPQLGHLLDFIHHGGPNIEIMKTLCLDSEFESHVWGISISAYSASKCADIQLTYLFLDLVLTV